MNSFVNVQVRVLAGQAMSQLAMIEKRLNGLEKGFGRAANSSNGLGSSINAMKLDAFGSKIQWVGRQLEYNFTLPIIAAGAASVKMALDNETAFKRIEKVYGDATHNSQMYSRELEALKRNFVALSNVYGVNQKEVLDVAASWAAAGASGLALAKSVDLTMQTMILGEMKAAEATEALIAIQAQYGQNVGELTKTLAVLNMVENQTGISLQGLVQGFSRAAGVARAGGVDVRNLAAMLAALVPATGSAAQAGNALKTIFSRLLSPTEEMVEVFGLMGIEFDSMEWKSANLTEQLHIMAERFQGLSDKQKGVVSSVAASRWQVNKFEVLMRDLLNTNGYYQRALQATRDETAVYNQMQKELNTVLDSSPRRLQILWTVMKNGAADVIQPMIPMILWLTANIAKLVKAFSELNPAVQKLILFSLLFLAAVGPIVRITGAMILLFAQLSVVVGALLTPFSMVAGALWALLKIPILGFIMGLGSAVQGGIRVALLGAAAVLRWFGGVMSVTLLAAAARAGVVWRAGMGLLATITTAGTQAILILWRRFMFFLTGLVLAGMRALGVAWRAGLAALAAIQKAWAALMAISWRAVFMAMIAMSAAGFRGIITLFKNFIPAIRAASAAVLAAMTGPWGLAITAIVVLILAFWDEIQKIWHAGSEWIVQTTVSAFNALPQGVRGALLAMVTLVQRAAMAIYEAFSWMNPWARHSPSLVENVTTGMAEIKKQYSAADRIVDIFKRAGFTLESFGKAVERLKRIADLQEIANQRKDLADVAASAIPQFDRLVKVLWPLKDLLKEINAQIERQEAVVSTWKSKLDAANAALDKEQALLSKLQDTADSYRDKLDAAQANLDKFANAPIEGMKAMSDAIFENEMQQKALRLEMMKMEDAIGPLDQLKGKIDAINGQMELLSGERANLRNAGAGGEILKQYDQQIALLDQQQQQIKDQIKPLEDLSKEIDNLGRKAEMLDLEQSLKFDPLKRQVDDLVNSMEELSFEEIIAGITKSKTEVDTLTQAYNQANAAVAAQQAVVDQATAARDAIQARYDAEVAKLQKLQDEYQAVESKIRDIETALQDMTSAAKAAAEAAGKGGGGALSPGAQNFLAGAGGNFPDPGGFAQIGREGGWGDQSAMIDEFTKEMADKTKNLFGMFDFLEPIKKGWNKAWGWLKENVGGAIGGLASNIQERFGGIGNPFEKFKSWVDTAKEIGEGVKSAMKMVWDLIGPEIIDAGKQAWAGLQDAFKDIQPEIEKFRDLVGPMGQALNNMWNILKPVLAVVLGLILAVVKALISGFAGAIGPVIRGLGDLIAGIIKIFRGLIEFFVGVWTLDWDQMWTGIKDIASGVWQAIWGVIKNAGNALWGLVKGIVQGIWDFFYWLWDELVGHSIIPDMVNAIIDWFKKLLDKGKELFNNLVNGIKAIWDAGLNWVKTKLDQTKTGLITILNALKSGATSVWEALKNALKSAWDWVWNQIKSKIDWGKSVISSAISGIKSVFTGLQNSWNSVVNALKKLVDSMVDKFNGIKRRLSFSGMFDSIKSAFRSAINWVIGKWNNLRFPAVSVGGVQLTPSIGTPNISYLAKGGMIARHAMAVIGEGRAGYPEYVIPTDPLHRRRAMALFNKLGGELGASASKKMVYAPNHTESRAYHFYGNLEFPNIKDGSDAEEFLRNLEALISEA